MILKLERRIDMDDPVPTLDVTINGCPVELPQAFWEGVWKEVARKIIEEDEKRKQSEPTT